MVGLIEEHLKRGKRIDEKFLNEIFSWVLEREVSPHDVLRVRHPNYIQELFDSFYDKATIELRTKVLMNLERVILQTTPFNGKVLSGDRELGLIGRLLTLLPHSNGELFEKMLQVIHILIAHSMSIQNVKQYINTLYQVGRLEGVVGKGKLMKMLQALHKTIRKEVSPQWMFDMDGLAIASGVLLPPLPPFPKAYTLSLWFKSETFLNPNHSSYTPRLFSFLSGEQPPSSSSSSSSSLSGLEAFFVTSSSKSTTLQIQTLFHSKVEKLIIPFKFMPKRWYHLSISHSYSLITKSELVCYIDGTEVYKGGLKFPNVSSSEGLTLNHLFTSHSASPHNSFFGQSTQFYIFKEALSVKEITKLFRLGVGYALNQSTKKDFITKEPLLAYCPQATDKATVYDVTPELFDRLQKKRSLYNASLIGGAQVIRGESIQESIYSAGGLDLFLPLFLLPFDPLSSSLPAPHLSSIASFHAILLDFLGDYMMINELFRREMVKRKGFEMMRELLERGSPHNLTLELLEALSKWKKVFTSSTCSSKFKKQLFKDLLFQFSLWSSGPFPFQLEYLSFLSSLSIHSPSLVKKAIGVQEMLDILQSYYWYSSPPKPSSRCPLLFSRCPDLSPDQLSQLRQPLLCLLRSILTSEAFIKPDAQCLVRFLLSCPDQGQIEDLLALILSLLLGPNKGEVSGVLDEAGSLLPFLSLLLSSHSEAVLVLAVRIIGVMVNGGSKKVKKSMNGKVGYQLIATALQAVPFTPSVYVALLEVATDRVSGEYRCPRSKPILSSSPLLRSPDFLHVLFSLLPLSSPFLPLILEDFACLLYQNEPAVEYCINQPLFIKWVMALFTKYIAMEGAGAGDSGGVYDPLLDLFSVLFHHCLVMKEGWKQIEMLVGYLCITQLPDSSSSSSSSSAAGIQEVFFYRLMESLSQILASFNDPSLSPSRPPHKPPLSPSDPPSPLPHLPILLQNLSFIGCIVDEYIFSPIDMEAKSKGEVTVVMKRGKEGKWRDYQMALEVLGLMDTVLFSPHCEAVNSELLHSAKARSLYTMMMRLTLLAMAESYRVYDNPLAKPTLLVIGSNKTREPLLQQPSPSPSSSSNASHEWLLDLSTSRLHQILSKIFKAHNPHSNNTPVTSTVWSLAYLFKICSHHKWLYKCYDQSVLRLIHSSLLSHHSLIEAFLRCSFPDLPAHTSYFALEKFIQAVQENAALISEMERVKNEMEGEMASLLYSLYDRRSKRSNDLAAALSDSSFLPSSSTSLLEVQMEEMKQENVQGETTRRAGWVIAQGNGQQEVKERWERLYIHLRHGGGGGDRYPWLLHSFGTATSHWQLHPSEDNLRRRWRMVLNEQPSDYHTYTWSFIRRPPDPSPLPPPLSLPLPPGEEDGDGEGEDDLPSDPSLLSPSSSSLLSIPPSLSPSPNEKTLLSSSCELISPLLVVGGKLLVSNKAIYFFPDPSDPSSSSSSPLPSLSEVMRDQKWRMGVIKGIHRRRYLLRNTALEIFFTDRTNVMVDLPKNIREKVISAILSTHPANLIDYTNIKSPSAILKASPMTARWQKREITNFEYLMYLNTVAGRTYNDLSQYPVFPWILSDYSSPSLDLSNPALYRDLSKPMGALNPKRLAEYEERYAMLGDDIPRFFYGSHYSTALVVLYYLLRMEPYTSYYIQLQGRFDHAERIFDSIATAWHTSCTLSQDVKELTPEFFYLPNFLRNENNFDLGEKQNEKGERIHHVQLPPWAKGSAEEFVRINAEALESDIVSASLHHWIDLIFGFKQKGKDAVEAKNVFYYMTYEGAVNIDKIEDPVLRKSTIAQILSFGQTPSQLFHKPHPPRSVNTSPSHYFSDPHFLHSVHSFDPKLTPAMIATCKDRLVVANEAGAVNLFKLQNFSPSNLSDLSFSLQLSSPPTYSFILPPNIARSPSFLIDSEIKVMISFGHWDGSIRLTQLQNTAIILQNIHLHQQPVMSMDYCEESGVIACGSMDSTVSLWKVKKTGKSATIKSSLLLLLRHQSPVSSVVINAPLDLIVSGGVDGSIVTHSLSSGELIRSIPDFDRHLSGGVDLLFVTPFATILAYCKSSQMMVLYSINGDLLAFTLLPNVNCILLTPSHILALGKRIDILHPHNLLLAHSFTKFENDEILSASFFFDQKFLLLGLKSSVLQLCVFS